MLRPTFTVAGFLDAASCRRIRHAMDDGVAEPAEILDGTFERQPDVRRAANIEIDESLVAEVERRLDGQRGAIGDFFALTLGEREGASFVRYHDGGFYKPHRDRATVPDWPGAARRRVAVVVFLNSSRAKDDRGDFAGGTLQLFVGQEPVDLHPQQGALVAFPADVLHQVTPVRNGTRDTIVDWFY
jgi:SM-20-related protein